MERTTLKRTNAKAHIKGKSFRLFDFQVKDEYPEIQDEDTPSSLFIQQDNFDFDNDECRPSHIPRPPKMASFVIEMYGINEKGETCCIFVQNFQPFFYIKVPHTWGNDNLQTLLHELKQTVKTGVMEQIANMEFVLSNSLYGFTAGNQSKFVKFSFKNMQAYYKIRNLWYYTPKNSNERKMKPLTSQCETLYIYESGIPPLLRFFHIHNISPSGWVLLPISKIYPVENPKTTCTFEYICEDANSILPQPNKEILTPFKICSFDIEASSSHGDFPVPIKTYKLLAMNIIDTHQKQCSVLAGGGALSLWDLDKLKAFLKKCIYSAFGFGKFSGIDIVYPKDKLSITRTNVNMWIQSFLEMKVVNSFGAGAGNKYITTIETFFEKVHEKTNGEDEVEGGGSGGGGGGGGEHEEEEQTQQCLDIDEDPVSLYDNENEDSDENEETPKMPLLELFSANTQMSRDEKIQLLNAALCKIFPPLEGDKITFIGSSFMTFGNSDPYLQHCLVLNSCAPVPNVQIETVATESELLMKWTELIQRENPDIIIGYNIFGFDYEFMLRRAQETACEREFLMLSRKNEEVSATYNSATASFRLENTKIVLATGDYDLHYPKISGRIQIDLYPYLRREFTNLSSYKLDDVAGAFIGDSIHKVSLETLAGNVQVTHLYTKNIIGLHAQDYIHIEISHFTNDYYKSGAKLCVLSIEQAPEKPNEKIICIAGWETPLLTQKNLKWCMSKDDVGPQDIFRYTNGTDAERAIVAKYCIQDCNLVHHLLSKLDILTGFVEMARICSVPIPFLVFRGQGIKLTSFVAKKCGEKNTLMPDLQKIKIDDGYEGAIVLPPKCAIYIDEPVACVDYSSLYPSSMISQNYSHDSKVWTKEYDLEGRLVQETGTKDRYGNFIYDNLPEYEYIHIEFDTFAYRKDNSKPNKKAVKTKIGKKVCCWAQSKSGPKSIMPSILEELLKARKDTKKLMEKETDPFMKNILDKRQLGYKVTANSLYGQCGSRTSTFYEKDVAASTTATGRMMIIYAKRIIEEVYANRICSLPSAPMITVCTNAKYIYGDSVAGYTPVYIRKGGGRVEVLTITKLVEKYGKIQWKKTRGGKEVCMLQNIDTWSEKGWTPLLSVIRHRLSVKKKMFRVATKKGVVDCTSDHSLLTPKGGKIRPTQLHIGSPILHFHLPSWKEDNYNIIHDIFDDYFPTVGNLWKLLHDISADTSFHIDFSRQSQIEIAKMYFLAFHAGWEVSLEVLEEENTYRLHVSSSSTTTSGTSSLDTSNYQIRSLKEIPFDKGETGEYVYDFTTENHHFSAGIGEIVVHNTDSVFFTFGLTRPESGVAIRGREALEITIELAQQVAQLCTKFLKPPMELSYEKTLMPFILLSKKRYVGMLYEENPNKCKLKYMGLSLKRRDCCDYLKDVYGSILNILMSGESNALQLALQHLDMCLNNLIEQRVPLEKLTISKSLRTHYKNPQQIAHFVLAERIGARDAGNKPKSGDRIPYAYIVTNNAHALLQGERIETPEYITKNNLQIDYTFYITNQLMKPIQQLLGLALEDIYRSKGASSKLINKYRSDLQGIERDCKGDLELYAKVKEKYSSVLVKTMIFDKYLSRIENKRTGMISITSYYCKKK